MWPRWVPYPLRWRDSPRHITSHRKFLWSLAPETAWEHVPHRRTTSFVWPSRCSIAPSIVRTCWRVVHLCIQNSKVHFPCSRRNDCVPFYSGRACLHMSFLVCPCNVKMLTISPTTSCLRGVSCSVNASFPGRNKYIPALYREIASHRGGHDSIRGRGVAPQDATLRLHLKWKLCVLTG